MKVPQGARFNGGFVLGIKAFAAAVLGGIGNIRGALLGGLILGVIEQLRRDPAGRRRSGPTS